MSSVSHDDRPEAGDLSAPADGGKLQVRGASGMRAMAHPARLAALGHLNLVGPATATELGEVVGLTPSAMSYHLRLLERAGFIATAPSRGDGRERVWKSNHTSWELESFEDGTDDTRAASLELIEAVLALQEIETRQWLAGAETPGWLDQGFFIDTNLLATKDELFELGRQIADLIKPLSRQSRRESPPPGAEPMRVMFRGFPYESRPSQSSPAEDAPAAA
jgi:DNA-binding transcriptional ArsR family regulator